VIDNLFEIDGIENVEIQIGLGLNCCFHIS